MATRRSIPGGLRAQLLVGLSLMLLGTFALVLITVENLVARQVRDAALAEAHAVATVVGSTIASGTAPDELLEPPVVAIADRERCVGRHCDLLQGGDRETRLVTRDSTVFGIATSRDSSTIVALPEFEERQKRARGFLWPFFLIDAIFVLALGYAFFTYLIVRPLRAIGVATTRAAEGDFASPITRLPRNEFGEVGRSFNRMLEEIEQGRSRLEDKVAEVESANARLASTQASLVRSEKLASVGQLSAGIAHEVGNPLAAISGYVELLSGVELDPNEREEVLERVSKQVVRIRSIIRNLLDFSRSDEDLHPMPIAVGSAVSDAVSLVEAMPRARDIDIVREGDAKALAVHNHLVQVMLNLLVNAVDAYGGDPGVVRVDVTESEGRVRIRVADDGPGIPQAELTRIFDPFFTTKDVGEGTGLGLSICQRLIEDLDGALEVESEVQGGTTFTIDLPAAETDVSRSQKEEVEE